MKNTNSNFISSSFGLSWLRASLNVAAFACASLLVITSLADAGGAQGVRVRRGNVSFSQDGNRLIVRASNGAIIEYDRLSVEAGQIMQFIQPGSRSRVLNRVTGSELTRIDGTLLSNGIVYLINPQGFRIGNGAVIKVGGFFAAAGAMSNSDFLSRRDRFSNLTGQVTNDGLIQAQAVALVGQYVANRGTIDVGNGYLAMGAGDSVVIQKGTGPVMVTVSRSQLGADGSGAGTQAAISNTGTINAGNGSVSMASGDFYALAMDLSGSIIGKSIAARGGKDGVVAVNGTLDASSSTGKGGKIDIFGDRVGLFGNALVNADGATGGGSIRIGGDYLGSNAANAPQANRTFIGSDARITANATQSGDGGRVIVWSNEYTGFFGSIEASAVGSGKGGFIETSSKGNLQAFGQVDASSALGQAGTWLLDPSNVEITINTNSNPAAFVNPWIPDNDSSQVSAVDIVAVLNANTNVIIQTNNAGGAQAGNITMEVGASITSSGTATLTLIAAGSINITETITGIGAGALSVVLGAVGSVNVAAAINTNGGNFTIQGADANGATLAASAGSAVLSANISTGAGSLSITATGAVNQTAGALVIGGTTSVTTGGAAITLTQAGNDFGGAVSLTNTGANNIAINDSTGLVLGTVSMSAGAAGTFNVTSVGLTQDGATTITTGTGAVTINAGAGVITLTNANDFNGAVSLTNTGANAVAITDTDNLVLGTVSMSAGAAGTFNVTSVGLTQDGATTITTGTGAVTINAGAGVITLTNLNDFNGAVSLTNTGANNIAITDSGGLILGTVSMSAASAGALAITSVGLIQDGVTTITTGTGAVTINGGAFLITLTNANDFNGAVSLTNTGANAVAITDANALILGASSVGQNLSIIASALDIQAAITAVGVVNITSNAGVNVGLGTAAVGLDISNADLGFITAASLNITAAGGGTMTVSGVTTGGIISGITTLTAGGFGVFFSGSSSAFNNALTVASLATIESVNLTTTGNMTFSNTVALTTGAVSLDSNGGAILFSSNLTGNNHDLTIAAGTGAGTTIFTGAVANMGDGTGAAITLNSTGLVDFQNTVGGASGIVSTNAAGSTRFQQDVTLTAGDTASTFAGAVNFDGMNWSGFLGLTVGAATLSSGAVNVNSNGSGITFSSTLNGGQALTLTAGAGDITFTGAVGAVPLTSILINSATNVTAGNGIAQNAFNAGTLTLTSVTGTATFTGALNLVTLSATGGVLNISSTGNGGTITNAVDYLNTGTLTLGQAAGTQTYNGGLRTAGAGGLVTMNGTFLTSDAAINLGAITLGSATTLNTVATTTAGDITLGAVTGANFGLNLSTGLGVANADVAGTTVSGVGTLALSNIGGTATFTGAVSAATLTVPATVVNVVSTGTGGTITNLVTFANSGTLTLGQAAGTQTYTGGLSTVAVGGTVTMNGTFNSTGDQTYGDLLLNSDLTHLSATGSIFYNGTINDLNLGQDTLTSTATLGNVQYDGLVGNTGLLGALIVTAGGTINLNSTTVETSSSGGGSGNQTYNSAVVLGNAVGSTLTSTVGGAITFASTLTDGAVARDLTLNAAGVVSFTGVDALGLIDINNLTITDALSATFAGNVQVNDLITTVNPYTVTMTGATNTFAQNIAYLNGGRVTMGDVAGTDTFLFNGGMNFTNNAPSSIGGFIRSPGVLLDFGTGGVLGVTLLSSSTVDSTNVGGTPAGAGINFGGIITDGVGAFDLALNAGTAGAIAATGVHALGLIDINNLTITNAASATFAGNVQVNDLITTVNPYTVTMTGATNTFAQNIAYLNGGRVTMGDVAGTDTFLFNGGMNFTNNAPSSIGGFIRSPGVLLDFGTGGVLGVTLLSSSTVDSTNVGGTPAGANINFGGIITDGVGAFDLALNAGTGGAIAATGVDALGLITINNLTITNAASATFAGNVQVNDLITTANPYTVTMTGATNTFAQNIAYLNGGRVTMGDVAGTDTFLFNGGMNFTNNAPSSIGGFIRSPGVLLDFGTGGVLGVTLLSSSTVDSTNLGVVAPGAGINFGGIITDGAFAFDLALNAGTTGTIAATGVNAAGAVTINDLTINNAASATFAGNVQVNDLITTANPYTVTMTGATNTFAQNIAYLNGGRVTMGDVAGTDTFLFNGGMNFTNNAPSSIGGFIRSPGLLLDFGTGGVLGVTLLSSSTVDSTNVGGTPLGAAITFGGILNGAFDLDLLAGFSNITFTGVVGGLNALNTVTVVSALQVAAGNGASQNAFNADTLTLTSVLQGATFTGALNLNTLSATGGVFNFTSTGTGGTIVNAVAFTNTGALTLGQAGGTQDFTNGLDTTGVIGLVTMNGSFTSGGDITQGNIVLGSNTIYNFNGIYTVGTVNGVNFDLTTKVADLFLTGNITNVGTFTIENFLAAGNITLMGAGGLSIQTQAEWNFIQPSVDFVVLGNTTTNVGAVTVAAAWTNDSAVTVDFLLNGAGEFNVNGNVSGTGSLTVNGSGNSTNINADLIQANFIFNDSVVVLGVLGGVTRTLTATGALGIVIDTTLSANGISADLPLTSLALLTTSAGAPITVTGTFTAAGGSGLTNLTMGGDGVNAGTITLVASGTILGALSADNASGIDLNSNAGTLTAGLMFFGENTTLTGTTTLVTTFADIDFGTGVATATLNGAEILTLTSAVDILFSGAVGNLNRLSDVTITSADTVLASSTFTAASFTQSAGSVATTFTGLVDLTSQFDFTGQDLSINGAGANVVGTTMDVDNAGLFTTAIDANLTVGNDFDQIGAGLNSIGGDITSTNDGIAFATGVTLTNGAGVTMTTGLIAGDDIFFGDTLDGTAPGAQSLTLVAGAGDITFTDAVGAGVGGPLGNILISSADDVDVGSSVVAASFTQTTGTGTTTFIGTQDYNGALGLNVTNETIVVDAAVTSTAGGVTLNATSTTLTIDTAADILSSGSVNLTANIAIITGGDVTVTGAGTVNFNSATILTDDILVNNNVGVGGNITFASTLTDGVSSLDLTLDAGTAGAIAFTGVNALGLVTINDLTLTNAASATFAGNVQVNDLITTVNPYTVTMVGASNSFVVNTDFLNSGLVTLGDAAGTDTFLFNGGLNFTTNALSEIGAIIRSPGQLIDFGTGGATLIGNSIVDSTNSSGTPTGANIVFGGTLDGTFNLQLTSGSTGDINFNDVVGGGTALNNVTVTSANNVNAGNGLAEFAFNAITLNLATITNTATFTGALNLTGLNTNAASWALVNNFSSTGTGGTITNLVTFANTGTLTLGQAGGTQDFTNGLDTTGVIGLVTMNGTFSSAAGDQNYGNITLGSDVTNVNAGGSINYNGTVDATSAGAQTLTSNASVDVLLAGLVGNLFELGSLTVTAGGTINLNSLSVDTEANVIAGTTGDQLFNSAVVLGNAVGSTLTSTGGGDIDFASTIDAATLGTQTLTVDAAGDAIFGDNIGAGLALGELDVTAGGTIDLNSLSVDTEANAIVGTTGDQLFNSAVVLGNAVGSTLTSTGGGDIDFASTIDAATLGTQTLTVDAAGDAIFGDNIGAGLALGELDVTAGGTIDLNSLSVDTEANAIVGTTGDQLFNSAVVLGNLVGSTLTSTGGGDIDFASTIDAATLGTQTLTVDAAGDAIFGDNIGAGLALGELDVTAGGTIDLNSLSVDTEANAIVGTTGDQLFNSAVVLGNLVGSTLTSTGGGDIDFASTIDAATLGTQTLTVDAAGDAIFGDNIGAGLALGELDVTAGGTIDLNSAIVNTNSAGATGDQLFNSAVVLGNAVGSTLTSTGGGDIDFASTIDAATLGTQTLTVDAAGDAIFDGNIGAGTDLGELDVTAGGTINLNSAIVNTEFNLIALTTGGQTYNSQVVLGNAVGSTLTSTVDGDIVFLSTIDADTNGLQTLTVDAAGSAEFGDNVGAIGELGELTVTADDGINIGFLTPITIDTLASGFAGTTGNQSYNSDVTVFQDAILTSSGGGDILFDESIEGAALGVNFTVSAADNAIFNGNIGAATALGSLDVTADTNVGVVTGNIQLNSLIVETEIAAGSAGSQDYNSQVVLGNAVGSTLTSTGGGTIAFADTVDAAAAGVQNLIVFTTGDVFFDAAVGSNASLATLTVTSADFTTHFAGNVTTVGDQLYNGGAQMDADIVFTATDTDGDITFNGEVRSGTGVENMTVRANGNVVFGNNVGGTDSTTQLGTFTVDCGDNFGETITFAALASTVRAVNVNLNTNTLLTTPATVATIVALDNISFANATFAMGQNEKLTSLGGIRINGLASLTSNATSVILGDVNAVGNLRVTSSSITLLARSAGSIRTNTGGSINDPMVDYVVGGQVFFSTAPVMGGSGGRATFSNPTGNVDGSGTLGNFAKTIYRTPITAALLTGQDGSGITGQILDLSAASGVSYTNPANLVPTPLSILPGIGLLGNSDTLDEAKDKKKAKAAKEGSTKKTASESKPEPTGVPVASR